VGWIKVAIGYLNIIPKHNMWTLVNEVAIEGFLPNDSTAIKPIQ